MFLMVSFLNRKKKTNPKKKPKKINSKADFPQLKLLSRKKWLVKPFKMEKSKPEIRIKISLCFNGIFIMISF